MGQDGSNLDVAIHSVQYSATSVSRPPENDSVSEMPAGKNLKQLEAQQSRATLQVSTG